MTTLAFQRNGKFSVSLRKAPPGSAGLPERSYTVSGKGSGGERVERRTNSCSVTSSLANRNEAACGDGTNTTKFGVGGRVLGERTSAVDFSRLEKLKPRGNFKETEVTLNNFNAGIRERNGDKVGSENHSVTKALTAHIAQRKGLSVTKPITTPVTQRNGITPNGTQTNRRTVDLKKETITPRRTNALEERRLNNTANGVRKETAAQRRLRENKGVRASNNPFKAQEETGNGAKTSSSEAKGTGETAATNNIDKLLKWIQKRVNQYKAVNVTNFTTSWEDGKALCALLNYLLGEEALNSDDVSPDDKIKNLTLAIKCATENGVPELIEPQEVGLDRRSMITYLHTIYTKLYMEKKEKDKTNEKEKNEE